MHEKEDKQFISSLLQESHIPGIATAIISGEGVITTKSAGVTNAEYPSEVTDSTVFEAASLSKPVIGDLSPISHWLSKREDLPMEKKANPVQDIKQRLQEQKQKTTEPHYMLPTESSKAKEREKYTPLSTIPKRQEKLIDGLDWIKLQQLFNQYQNNVSGASLSGNAKPLTFQMLLDEYAKYYNKLEDSQEKKALSNTFWAQIKSLGTPIIEKIPRDDTQCNVYFLFPKKELPEGKDLYLQGDFHGYGSTDGRQKLSELADTGIMYRTDPMPMDAIVTYYYSKVEHSHGGRKPIPEHSPFFDEKFGPVHSDDVEFPEISQVPCKDKCSKHRSTFPDFDSPECVFRVNPDSNKAHISGEKINWPVLLSRYDLALMSDLKNDSNQAQSNKIYLAEDGSYLVRDLFDKEKVHQGKLDFQLNLSISQLEDPSLKGMILDATSKAGHTLSKATHDQRHFSYHATLYSDKEGNLQPQPDKTRVSEKYHDDLYFSNGYNLSLSVVSSFHELDTNTLGKTPQLIKDEKNDHYKIWGCKEDGTWQLTDIESDKVPPEWGQNKEVFVTVTDPIFETLKEGHTPYLPYAEFTRAVQVFKPAGKIDNIIVINDAIPYLFSGILDNFENMVKATGEHKLSPNTALVFVGPLPGLKETLSGEEEKIAFETDPSASLPGMGIRLIDYKHGIDKYADWIANKLFPQLEKEKINVPDADHRVMIGSSLSGTASVYIGLQHPDLFGTVIAQSPSPDNREILSIIPSKTRTGNKNIHLSCGKFEHPNYAAANANVEYAIELSDKLKLSKPDIGSHGHQFIAWNEELEKSVPEALNQIHSKKQTLNMKAAMQTMKDHQDLSQTQEIVEIKKP